jgi:hypothetical protein
MEVNDVCLIFLLKKKSAIRKGDEKMGVTTKSESSIGQIFGGLALFAIFGFLTWLQVGRITKESYWIIFRIWFIPVPVIFLTGIATLGGIVLFFQGIFNSVSAISRK